MMMPQPLPKSPSYQAEMSALLRMHQLSVTGKEDSEEADLVRESASDFWDDLSKIEKDRLTGLSKDLYEISDKPVQPPEPMNPQAQAKIVEIYEARERGDWENALELLRGEGEYLPPAIVSYFRGRMWQYAGEAKTAAVFFEHASQLAPENENYQAALLHNLKDADLDIAEKRANAVLRVSDTKSPTLVIYAADIVFEVTRHRSERDSLDDYNRLIPILKDTLTRMEGKEQVGAALPGMVLGLLAMSYRGIGDTRKACGYYTRAIQLDPTNIPLLIARGILMYGTDPNAIADFDQAIQLGSSQVWPYFFLAHHYLGNNRFEECRLMCERARYLPATARVQSELGEFLAISMAGLGYPEQVIRRMFEHAIRVDLSNDRARRNMERFETALATRTTHKEWERISDSSMRKYGREEIRSHAGYSEKANLVPV